MRVLVLVLAACGSSPPPPVPVGPPASLVAAPRDPADSIVAHVNGRPVFASCVEAQGHAHHLAARAALDECIAFELMAQEAERRGLVRDPEVVLAAKTALVSRLVATAYEDGMQDPEAFGSAWDKFDRQSEWFFKHDEYRASTYVRVPVPPNSPPEVDASAKQLAEQIAAAAAPERGMLSRHLRELAEKITPLKEHCTADIKVTCWDDIGPFLEDGLEGNYGRALFAVPEVGRTSPAVRTKWGWDIILWSDVVPPEHPSPDALVRKMLPEFKQAYFAMWVKQIEKSLGVKIELDPNAAAALGSTP